jgi:hypothetical protein
MLRRAALVAHLLALAVPVACSGRVADGPGDDEAGIDDLLEGGRPTPGCPASSEVSSGATCSSSPLVSCPSSTPIFGCAGRIEGFVSCDCLGSRWICPPPRGPGCLDAAPGESVESGTPLSMSWCAEGGKPLDACPASRRPPDAGEDAFAR